jgi:hypothetical protein
MSLNLSMYKYMAVLTNQLGGSAFSEAGVPHPDPSEKAHLQQDRVCLQELVLFLRGGLWYGIDWKYPIPTFFRRTILAFTTPPLKMT